MSSERADSMRGRGGRRHAWAMVCAVCGMCSAWSCQREAPLEPGTFVVLVDTSPNGFDPRFPASDASAKIMGLIHAGLVSMDTRDGEPVLALAESIEQPSPTRYEVVLRPGLTFHDGAPLTSADVRYTLMELGSEQVKSPLSGLSERIARFDIHDARRFTIELREPRAPFLTELTMGIVPEHLCGELPECPAPVVGAGAFRMMSQSEDGQLVRLQAFDAYSGGKPHIEHLAIKVVKDDTTRLLALLGKTADLVQNAVSPVMLPVVQEEEALDVQIDTSFKYTYLAFNLRRPALQDVRVRQAIAHALDREAIIQHKYRGLAELSTGMIAPGHWAYEGDVARYDHDLERARTLLDEAGFPDPDGPDGPEPRFELELKVSSNKFRRALALLMARQLEEVGIRVKVRAYEWGTYFYDIKAGNFDITTLQWPSVLEPSMLHWVFHSSNIPSPERVSAGANRGAYKNEELDALLDAGMTEVDRVKRRAIYSRAQQILAHDLPYVSLWHEHNIAVLRRGVTGYTTTPNARFEALKVASPAPSSRAAAQE